MKYTTASIAASLAALTSATPLTKPTGPIIPDTCSPNHPDLFPVAGDVFQLISLPDSGSTIVCGAVQAKLNGFVLDSNSQGANCTRPLNYASFILNGVGNLFLNTGADTGNPIQQIVIDRSGMGMGNMQYTTGDAGIGRNQERGPFRINKEQNLVFYDRSGQETRFQACPGAAEGGWSVWLAGAKEPAGLKGCIEFDARAIKQTEPVACEYSQYP